MSVLSPVDRVVKVVTKACEDAYQNAFTAFLAHVEQSPSSDFIVRGTDVGIMKYVRDRFLSDKFEATISEESMQYVVTVNMRKHFPTLTAMEHRAERILSSPRENFFSSKPSPNSSAEVDFTIYHWPGLSEQLIQLGYQAEDTGHRYYLESRVMGEKHIRLRRNHPIVLPRTHSIFGFSHILEKDRFRVKEFLRSEGFANIVYHAHGDTLYFAFPHPE